jgi:ParB family transcriptional regulator, chromosome partitioning protein
LILEFGNETEEQRMERTRGLGRGLGALIGEQDAVRPREAVVEVPVEEIRPNPYQPRHAMDDTALHELSESIRQHGVLQPIVLRRAAGGYELVAGERRYRAAQLAGLSRVPACVRDYTDRQSLEIALVENLQREDLGALEAARAYRRLIDEFGLTQEQIASQLGKSRTTVTNTLRLLQLPHRVQRSLEAGEISEGHARAMLQANPEQREAVLEQVIRSGANVRETEELAKQPINGEPGVGPIQRSRSRDANLQAVESRLRQALGTKVQIRGSTGKGVISIEFYSEADLERLLSLMGEGG